MQPNIEEITKNFFNLSKKERLEIARFILFLDTQSLDIDVESAWENEIIDRARAVDEGKAIGIDFNKALKKIEKRFAV
ncbi:MAG: addiction module protein [Desulfobacula sp.]|nr:addiction module protein [Desulfobacula sp.]MBT3806031.1 addiction module protein [Desulfobacula sp.]MBT4026466.1 addiction module protein [Desulfobacula sp.]MBT4200305.1 addiction module protein [Desulfobacula sp.]MBT4508876.1 addiction module protein [Desulfobacula sp.]